LALDQLRAVLDELAGAGVRSRQSRSERPYPVTGRDHGTRI